MSDHRVPKGVPTGGEFTARPHGEATDVMLAPPSISVDPPEVTFRSRRLLLSQAFGEPIEVHGMELTIVADPDRPVTVSGSGHHIDDSGNRRPVRFRTRTLEDLEGTNPGLTAALREHSPVLDDFLGSRTAPPSGFDRDDLRRRRREEMHHDRELASLELEFELSGGRGIELAERIDELRRRYAEPVDATVRGTAGCWTAEATFFDRPVVGLIYDVESDPTHPDSTLEPGDAAPDRGDPLLVVWNDDGDVTDEGPRSVSLHSIPGMSERIAGARDAEALPVDVATADDGRGGLTATFSFAGVRVAEVKLATGSTTGTVTVFDLSGAPVAIDGSEQRTFEVVPPRDPWRPDPIGS